MRVFAVHGLVHACALDVGAVSALACLFSVVSPRLPPLALVSLPPRLEGVQNPLRPLHSSCWRIRKWNLCVNQKQVDECGFLHLMHQHWAKRVSSEIRPAPPMAPLPRARVAVMFEPIEQTFSPLEFAGSGGVGRGLRDMLSSFLGLNTEEGFWRR